MTAESHRPANRVRAASAQPFSSVAVDPKFIQIPASTLPDREKRFCIEQTGGTKPRPPSRDHAAGITVKVEGLLLPGALRTAGFPFCCPAGSEPRYFGVTLGR